MKYGHIASYIASTPWAMLESKIVEMMAVFAFRAEGNRFTAEDIKAQIGDGNPPATASKNGAVAVIPLRGIIAHRMGTMEESSGGMSADRFTKMVKQATSDESIGTILLDVDSPGGSIPGLIEASDAVFAARSTKRVYAIANSTMASAAYWIASQAQEVVAIPSALDPSIGSIGVVAVHMDMTEHLAKEGVKVTIIRAGAHKAEGNPFEVPSEEFFARMQASADTAKAVFVKHVARGRGITSAQVVQQYGDGSAFSAQDAKSAGLIDRIATMDETIGRLVGRKSSAGMRAEALDTRRLV